VSDVEAGDAGEQEKAYYMEISRTVMDAIEQLRRQSQAKTEVGKKVTG